MPIKDVDIRTTLLKTLSKKNSYCVDCRIISELAVCDGNARVDVAVLNGHLCGYEIKSDSDSLDRLPNQRECYNRTFDKVYIIVGKKFLDSIEAIIPDWWGVYFAKKEKCKQLVSLKLIKKASINPCVDGHALLELLWTEEIKKLLVEWNIKHLSGKNRRMLRDLACERIPVSAIRGYTLKTLKAREMWRVSPCCQTVKQHS